MDKIFWSKKLSDSILLLAIYQSWFAQWSFENDDAWSVQRFDYFGSQSDLECLLKSKVRFEINVKIVINNFMKDSVKSNLFGIPLRYFN